MLLLLLGLEGDVVGCGEEAGEGVRRGEGGRVHVRLLLLMLMLAGRRGRVPRDDIKRALPELDQFPIVEPHAEPRVRVRGRFDHLGFRVGVHGQLGVQGLDTTNEDARPDHQPVRSETGVGQLRLMLQRGLLHRLLVLGGDRVVARARGGDGGRRGRGSGRRDGGERRRRVLAAVLRVVLGLVLLVMMVVVQKLLLLQRVLVLLLLLLELLLRVAELVRWVHQVLLVRVLRVQLHLRRRCMSIVLLLLLVLASACSAIRRQAHARLGGMRVVHRRPAHSRVQGEGLHSTGV